MSSEEYSPRLISTDRIVIVWGRKGGGGGQFHVNEHPQCIVMRLVCDAYSFFHHHHPQCCCVVVISRL